MNRLGEIFSSSKKLISLECFAHFLFPALFLCRFMNYDGFSRTGADSQNGYKTELF